MPPRDVREALDAFVQSVVAVTGGDTFLPDQLGDAASAAFEAVGEDALARDDEYRRPSPRRRTRATRTSRRERRTRSNA